MEASTTGIGTQIAAYHSQCRLKIVLKCDCSQILEIPMSKIENIEREIQELTPSELVDFRKWFHEFDTENWDRQIEEDALAGKLDTLADKAIKAFKSGRCTEF